MTTLSTAGWTSYLDAPIEIGPARGALVIAIVCGVAFDLGIRWGFDGVAGATAALIVSVGLLLSGRIRNPQARVLVAAAPLFGVWLMIRATPWLLPFDVLATAALLLLGTSLSSSGSLFDVGVPQALVRGTQAIVQAALAPAFLAMSRGRTSEETTGRRVVRGVLIAAPLVIVLAALFASADAIFAHVLGVNLGAAIWHIVAITIGTIGTAWLLRMASLRQTAIPRVAGPTLAPIEWTIVLAALDLILGGFAATQLVAISSGGKHVLQTAGLTYAQYARSGFFQLLAVLAITGLSLMALHAASGGSRRRASFRVLSFVAIALTYVVAVSAFHRLSLYEHVYGLTMLRLYVDIAIAGAGVLLAVLVVRIAGLADHRAWFAPVAGIVILATLFGLNVANPEAIVARYNVEHPSAHFDPAYLGQLTSDAAPALVDTRAGCATPGERRSTFAFNFSRYRAKSLTKEHCQ